MHGRRAWPQREGGSAAGRMADQVESWLKNAGLQNYYSMFAELGIDEKSFPLLTLQVPRPRTPPRGPSSLVATACRSCCARCSRAPTEQHTDSTHATQAHRQCGSIKSGAPHSSRPSQQADSEAHSGMHTRQCDPPFTLPRASHGRADQPAACHRTCTRSAWTTSPTASGCSS